MTLRQLILPALFAATLHAGLLLIPGQPPPPPLPEPKKPEPIKWGEIPVVPPDDDPIYRPLTDPAEKKSTSPSPPELDPVHMPPIDDSGWKIPFTFDPPRTNIDPKAMTPGPRDILERGTKLGGNGTGLEVFGVDVLDKTPRTISQIAPMYPPHLKTAGIEGTVLITFTVDENGVVHDARIVETTDAGFNEPALRAVARWRFEPGRHHGRRVAFKMSVPITFTLSDTE